MKSNVTDHKAVMQINGSHFVWFQGSALHLPPGQFAKLQQIQWRPRQTTDSGQVQGEDAPGSGDAPPSRITLTHTHSHSLSCLGARLVFCPGRRSETLWVHLCSFGFCSCIGNQPELELMGLEFSKLGAAGLILGDKLWAELRRNKHVCWF